MITVYTKDDCPFCVKAKALLNEHGLEYTEININEDKTARHFIMLEGHTTVPQLYTDKDELFVKGGYEGLREHFEKQNTQNTLGELSL